MSQSTVDSCIFAECSLLSLQSALLEQLMSRIVLLRKTYAEVFEPHRLAHFSKLSMCDACKNAASTVTISGYER